MTAGASGIWDDTTIDHDATLELNNNTLDTNSILEKEEVAFKDNERQEKEFKEFVSSLADQELRLLIEGVARDRTYIPTRYTLKWCEYIGKIIELVKIIIETLFRCDLNLLDEATGETNMQLIAKLEKILLAKFSESPPFTVVQFLKTLVFLSPSDCQPNISEFFSTAGLENKKLEQQKTADLTDNGDLEEINKDFEHNMQEKTDIYQRNQVLARHYLMNLICIIKVETTVKEIYDDLNKNRSINRINPEKESVNCSGKSDDEDENSVKLFDKITWE